jgi:F420-dependent oxidoreductase-like protein
MKLALHPMDFTWPGGPAAIAPTLATMLARAEDAGVHSVWPMDHFFQIGVVGAPEEPMLEGWSLLAWAAARTERLQFGTLVTGVHHRPPGMLGKLVTTLDVLSGGRAWLGIGAGWNEEESRGLGIPFPPLAERFERLTETLRIVRQMLDGDATPFAGTHYTLERPLNVPAPVRRPPVLIGGSGEKKTLRLVAEFGDACNLFEVPEVLRHKLDVLRRHCDDVGRDYDTIVRTTTGRLGDDRDLGRAVARFAALADLGVDLAIVDVPATDAGTYDFLAKLVAELEPLGRPAPALLG